MQRSSDNNKTLKKIRFILGITSGKGGVGKSTVTVDLGRAFMREGLKVGILDGDIYGPSIHEMLPEEKPPRVQGNQVVPAIAGGMALMSVAYFHKGRNASVIRAPIANQIILQFIEEVDWEELDVLLVDFPPGTGDIQITLMQKVAFSGVVVVTTPQDLALLDVRKSAQMCMQMGAPLIGVIENMSYFKDPQSGKSHCLFGEGGGQVIADEFYIPLLAKIPIDPAFNQKELDTSLYLKEAAKKILEDLKDEKVREIKEEDRYHFSIHWLDGKKSLYRGSDVQNHCPCAKCVENGKTQEIDSATEVERIVRVGRYGLQLVFTKGCSQGIYPFSLLRDLDR